MVLISWRAMRAIRTLMILMCFSRSSISHTGGTEIVTETDTVTETMGTATGITTMMMTATSVSTEAMTTMIMPRPLDPPFNVTAIAIDTTSFIVTWNHTGDKSTTFNVKFETDGEPDNGTISNVQPGVEVTERRPGESYRVTVISQLSDQKAESNSSVVRLFPESVMNLIEVTIPPNSSYIQVQWEPSDGVVTGYKMECSPGYLLEVSLSKDDTIGTCVNITAGGNVTVNVTSVAGSDEDGDLMEGAPESEVFTAYPNIVKNLDVLSRMDSNVSVQWISPDGTFDGYNVECSGNATPLDAILSPSALTATCTNVTAGSKVNVTVSTTSFFKENPASILVKALPGKVVDLEETSATTDNVTVSWELPSDHNNKTYKYQAVWSDEDEDVECYVAPSNTEAVCANVDPGSPITVTVITVNGDLNNSASISARAYPLAVSDVHSVDVSPNSISVSWREPEGVVEQYEVSCSEGTPNPSVVNRAYNLTSTCEGLVGGESVTIMITTVSGNKKTSATFNFRAEPNRVVNLREELVGTDFVLASWERPNGTVTEYNISCEDGGTASPVLDDGSSQYNASCQKLPIPGEIYHITVTPYSFEVSGEGSTIPIAAEPAAPELLDDSSTVDSVSVSFNESEGMVDYYLVECDNGTAKESNITDGGDLTATCYIETPGGTYLINVTAVSNGKNSSTVSRQVTALPESVALEKGDSTVNSVQASWSSPRGIVERFIVSCSSNAFPEDPFIESDSSIDIYTAKCNVAIPGDLYTIEVISDSSGEKSKAASEELRALPSNVASLTTSVYAENVTVTWDKPAGVVDSYDTSILDDNDGVVEGAERVTGTIVSFENLTAGTNYTIAVCSRSGDQTCMDNTTAKIRTLPTPPSRPRDVQASSPGVNNVTVSFLNSDNPNGYISYYVIEYYGTKEGNSDHSANVTVEVLDSDEEDIDVLYNVVVENLRAGHFYIFWVFAHNRRFRSDRSDNATETTNQTAPVISGISPVLDFTSGRRDIEIIINPNIFRHCNGEILSYTVLVDGKQYIAYQPFPFAPDYSNCGDSSERKRRNADDGDVITLMIGDSSNKGDGYSNDKLKTNTNYSIAIRVVNEIDFADSDPTYILTGPVHPAAYVVPIVLVILILIFVLVGYVVWKERREPGSVRNNIRKKFYRNGGIDNPGFITDKPMRRTGNSRPVKLSGFALHLEEMSRDSDYLFSEEYNDLRPIGKNQADDAAKLDCNKVKNRFSNILPYDHTRVKLMPNDDEPGSDFINANYMIGHKSNREYIACQGPLQNTEEDMWRMVWEQGASLIVMVTQLMEGNKIKCHQYWPQDGEGPVRYGDIVVLARGTEHNELWVKRLFTLTKGPATREVVHYNFTAWPDHGVPDSPDHLIKFVKAVRESKKYDGKPVVVHCSAGVGRTGTFISLDTLMSQMESSDEVDIFGLVRRMRMNRCLMVQTEIQYIYIHQCVMALLEGTTENTYENYNGNEDPYYNEALI